MMSNQQSLSSLLGGSTPVMIARNEKIEGAPLVTPLLNEDGSPKVDLNGNELGSIRLEQHSSSINGTFFNTRRRVAFLTSTLDNLNELVKRNNLEHGTAIAGRIVWNESLSPFFKGQDPKMNPQTAEVIGVEVNGKNYPVYMQMKYVDDISVKDNFIKTPEDVVAWHASNTINVTENVIGEKAGVPTE